MVNYTINIVRGEKQGTLTFKHGTVNVNTTCWWDPKVKVVPGSYTGYATHMAKKKREGIWLGRSVPIMNRTRKSNDIFIHKGTSSSWSDGCIVIKESELLKIWNCISPKETGNITVSIAEKSVGVRPAPGTMPRYYVPYGHHIPR